MVIICHQKCLTTDGDTKTYIIFPHPKSAMNKVIDFRIRKTDDFVGILSVRITLIVVITLMSLLGPYYRPHFIVLLVLLEFSKGLKKFKNILYMLSFLSSLNNRRVNHLLFYNIHVTSC